jgi:hypothetical protein
MNRNLKYYQHPLDYFSQYSNRISPSDELYVGTLLFKQNNFYFCITQHYSNMLINYAILKDELESNGESIPPSYHSQENFEILAKNATFDSKKIVNFLKEEMLNKKIFQ